MKFPWENTMKNMKLSIILFLAMDFITRVDCSLYISFKFMI